MGRGGSFISTAGLLLVGMLALQACGGSDEEPADATRGADALPTTSSGAVTTTVTTLQPALTQEQAGRRFVEITAPVNAAVAAFNDAAQAIKTDADLPKFQQAAQTLTDVMGNYSRQLQAEKWPIDVQPQVDDAVKSVTEASAAVRQIATATTAAQVATQFPALFVLAARASASSDLIRQKLGLPASR
jgi:hypothetical protein